MKSPEEIESALFRLAPPALSSRAQSNVAAMLTDLAAQSAPSSSPPRHAFSFRLRNPLVTGAAAAMLLLGFGNSLQDSPAPSSPPPLAAMAGSLQEMSPAPAVFIDRMLVTDGPTIVNTVTESDGTMLKQLNRRVQSHERFRDSRRGYLITVSETRDEKLYLPKNRF